MNSKKLPVNLINIGWVGNTATTPQHPTTPMGAAPSSGTITSDI